MITSCESSTGVGTKGGSSGTVNRLRNDMESFCAPSCGAVGDLSSSSHWLSSIVPAKICVRPSPAGPTTVTPGMKVLVADRRTEVDAAGDLDWNCIGDSNRGGRGVSVTEASSSSSSDITLLFLE